MGVSQREYAKIRGCSPTSVQKAVRDKRISLEADGTIDIQKANVEWFMNTNQAKSRKSDPLVDEMYQEQNKSSATKKAPNFMEIKTAHVYVQTMNLKEKLKILKGQYVERKKAQEYTYQIAKAFVDLMLNFSVRYGALIAAELETDEHKTVAIIDGYIRELLSNSEEIIERRL